MEVTDMIKVLNKVLRDLGCSEGTHCVMQKVILPHETMKAYKQFDYTIWCFINKKKYQLFRRTHTARVVTEAEEKKVIEFMEEEILEHLFVLFWSGNTLSQIINETFTGYGI